MADQESTHAGSAASQQARGTPGSGPRDDRHRSDGPERERLDVPTAPSSEEAPEEAPEGAADGAPEKEE